MTGTRLAFGATLALAVAILGVLWTRIDVAATAVQLGRVGLMGAGVVLLDMAVALLGPVVAWHILMRADGIAIGFGTTLASGLMGQAVNLISPMMYFGGEGVRTLYVARVTGAARSRVLATIVTGEFQQLTALVAAIVASLFIVLGSSRSSAMATSWVIVGTLALAGIVVLILSAVLLDLRLLGRALGLLVRAGIFPGRLAPVRQAAENMEAVVRGLMVRHTRPFLASQVIMFLSPAAQFVLPAIFFWLLRSTGGDSVPQPTLAELASCFVLLQLLFMLPTTPAGLGVYEGGIVGIFRLHGWNVPEGAAYAILFRLDDVLFSLVGVVLLARVGLMNFLGGAKAAAPGISEPLAESADAKGSPHA